MTWVRSPDSGPATRNPVIYAVEDGLDCKVHKLDIEGDLIDLDGFPG